MNQGNIQKLFVKGERGKKTVNGLNAYDILRLPECHLSLPTARSMTQAKIDYEHREDGIINWYINDYLTQKKVSNG